MSQIFVLMVFVIYNRSQYQIWYWVQGFVSGDSAFIFPFAVINFSYSANKLLNKYLKDPIDVRLLVGVWNDIFYEKKQKSHIWV